MTAPTFKIFDVVKILPSSSTIELEVGDREGVILGVAAEDESDTRWYAVDVADMGNDHDRGV